MNRLRTLLLLVVFLLVAADPTPRFLGIRRLPTKPLPSQLGAQKVRTVLETYNLPAAVAARAGVDAHATGALVALEPASGPCAVPAPEKATLAASLAAPSPHDDRRTGVGPPLRC